MKIQSFSRIAVLALAFAVFYSCSNGNDPDEENPGNSSNSNYGNSSSSNNGSGNGNSSSQQTGNETGEWCVNHDFRECIPRSWLPNLGTSCSEMEGGVTMDACPEGYENLSGNPGGACYSEPQDPNIDMNICVEGRNISITQEMCDDMSNADNIYEYRESCPPYPVLTCDDSGLFSLIPFHLYGSAAENEAINCEYLESIIDL